MSVQQTIDQTVAGQTMTGAEMVIKALIDQGVEVIFGYPGGAVLPMYDALFKQNSIRHILVRHEQGAVHAAEGYARSTGKVGVVLVTSGPGATNAVTGLTDALMDSIPIVCLTGQVATHLIGNDAFQECDTTGITRPCTKHNWLVKNVNNLARTMHEAFYIAKSGRPGPVVIDLPKDIQVATGTYIGPSNVVHKTYRPRIKGDQEKIAAAVEMIAKAKRPVFYTGGGVINSGPRASELLRELAKATGFPVTSTLMGLGAFPASDRQWLGMLGMHGTWEANHVMHGCDLMVNIGARFDDRITGRLNAFSPNSKKIHIDIDPSSINKTVRVDLGIIGDVASVLEDMLGQEAKARPGRQHMLDDAYFARVEAIQFTIAHDDGTAWEDWENADIVLAGVSRSSKTPTSIYLANRGYKVANIPIVVESPPPPALFSLRRPLVVGLTTAPERLIQVRRNRLLSLNQAPETAYVDADRVAREVQYARRMFGDNGWPVIDVTRRSIEETAAAVIKLYNEHKASGESADAGAKPI